MARKKNYDLTHKVTRILAGDYAFLLEISHKSGKPMAEVLHTILQQQDVKIEIPAQQIPWSAYVMPTGASIAIDGSTPRRTATAMKPKGGKISE